MILISIFCIVTFAIIMTSLTSEVFNAVSTNEFRVKYSWFGQYKLQQKFTGRQYSVEMGPMDVYFWKTIGRV